MKSELTTLRAREFARQAGVTVRTLHHYDRLGLIRPRRTRARYRVNEQGDLETLHLIRVLKFVGLSLKTIKELTKAKPDALLKAVRDQRGALEAKRAGLELAIQLDSTRSLSPRPALCLPRPLPRPPPTVYGRSSVEWTIRMSANS